MKIAITMTLIMLLSLITFSTYGKEGTTREVVVDVYEKNTELDQMDFRSGYDPVTLTVNVMDNSLKKVKIKFDYLATKETCDRVGSGVNGLGKLFIFCTWYTYEEVKRRKRIKIDLKSLAMPDGSVPEIIKFEIKKSYRYDTRPKHIMLEPKRPSE